ncbi:collagen binding domain-containing protein [Kutzneria buriramensis]|uniref:alpha-amylase n=1 Tax=Kutzneria buriramensis TaxID=1045776 RepID=A0A3E0HCR8_9PSEU|nr:carboxypeptidase-like regulatory domain-containing protein [Kutzneria buriramensis]REH42529.1 carboxypeptidase family protein [Kutzneria buriramensis]
MDSSLIRGRVLGADGALIGRAALTLIDAGGRQVGRTSSEVDGTYHFNVAASGGHVLIVTAPGHQPQAVTVMVEPNGARVDVTLAGTSGLSGLVHSAGGAPVPSAAVTIADGRGEVVASRVTGADGCYSFDELVAGSYTLAVSAATLRPVAMTVTIPATGRITQDVELAGGARVRGVVRTNGSGRAVEARVTLVDAEGVVIAATATESDGSYVFEDVPEGEYTIIATGYPPAASALRVAGGNQRRHDIELSF